MGFPVEDFPPELRVPLEDLLLRLPKFDLIGLRGHDMFGEHVVVLGRAEHGSWLVATLTGVVRSATRVFANLSDASTRDRILRAMMALRGGHQTGAPAFGPVYGWAPDNPWLQPHFRGYYLGYDDVSRAGPTFPVWTFERLDMDDTTLLPDLSSMRDALALIAILYRDPLLRPVKSGFQSDEGTRTPLEEET